jgi:tRNA A-37 threonylcarbamoyl transferase component Bud32
MKRGLSVKRSQARICKPQIDIGVIMFGRFPRRITDLARFLEQSEILDINGKKIVLKKYSGVPGILKWSALYLHPASLYYPLTSDPLERLLREEKFFTTPPKGIQTPRIIEVDYKRIVMKREMIYGKPLEPLPEQARLLGKAIGIIHVEGYRLGDTRSQNFLLTGDSQVAVIDAEQSIVSNEESYRAWDVLVFTYFLHLDTIFSGFQLFEMILKHFFDSYCSIGLGLSYKSLEKIKPIFILFPLPHRRIIRRALSSSECSL